MNTTMQIANTVRWMAFFSAGTSVVAFANKPTREGGAVAMVATGFLLASAEAFKEMEKKANPSMAGYVVELALDSACAGFDVAIAVGLFFSQVAGACRYTVRQMIS